jgi:hypothetical protein
MASRKSLSTIRRTEGQSDDTTEDSATAQATARSGAHETRNRGARARPSKRSARRQTLIEEVPDPASALKPAATSSDSETASPPATAKSRDDGYRSREPSDIEIHALLGACFLQETSPTHTARRIAETALTASRIEAICVPQGWRTFPADANTNQDDIPIVLRLRDVLERYGHHSVDELWFSRVRYTLSSAQDALDRATASGDSRAGDIQSDIEALYAEIARQRGLRRD